MSYAGNTPGVSAAAKQYFCYECNHTVTINPSSSSELICPDCNGGFLEEYENPNPNPTPNPNQNPFFAFSPENLSPFPGFGGSPFVLSTSGGGGAGGADLPDLSALFGGGGPNRFQSPDEFNPFAFLQNYLNTLREGGANIQFVVENNNPMGDAGFHLPTNLGDYFIGPGLEQLIQQLAENDPNRYGTPPAAKSAIQGLPTIKITKELMKIDVSECAVCKDGFNLEEEAKQMPCKHLYHADCILPWLEMHNSCPVCRYELPTDDQEYENRARGGVQGNGGGAGSGAVGSGENLDSPRGMERRFRIQLPWPFRTSGEGSNSRAGDRDGGDNNAGGSNSGTQAREEDLD